MSALFRRCRADIKQILGGSGREVFYQFVFDAAGRWHLTPTVESEYGGVRYLVRTGDKVIGRGIFDGTGTEVKEIRQVLDLVSQSLGPDFLKGRTSMLARISGLYRCQPWLRGARRGQLLLSRSRRTIGCFAVMPS
jgi:hypothetical protein